MCDQNWTKKDKMSYKNEIEISAIKVIERGCTNLI